MGLDVGVPIGRCCCRRSRCCFGLVYALALGRGRLLRLVLRLLLLPNDADADGDVCELAIERVLLELGQCWRSGVSARAMCRAAQYACSDVPILCCCNCTPSSRHPPPPSLTLHAYGVCIGGTVTSDENDREEGERGERKQGSADRSRHCALMCARECEVQRTVSRSSVASCVVPNVWGRCGTLWP